MNKDRKQKHSEVEIVYLWAMILVTGATGLVGHYLLARLIRGQQAITAIYRTEQKRQTALKRIKTILGTSYISAIDDIHWEKADILDIPRMEDVFDGVSEVYHCAGLVSFDVRDKDCLRKINIEGTANMVNIALKQGVKKFCHLSSVAALGHELNNKPIHEKSPRNADNSHGYYDISKYGAEMEVWRGSQEGLPVVIVNPGIIIGAGNWSSGSGQLFSVVAKGFPLRIPKKTGFVDVDDVVLAMTELMTNPIVNERYVVVGESVRLETVTNIIAKNLNVKPPWLKLRPWMVRCLWIAQSIGYIFGGAKQLTRQSPKEMFLDTEFDTTKIEDQLGFKFTPLITAIEKTANFYLREHPEATEN